jgi:hypothetical protein
VASRLVAAGEARAAALAIEVTSERFRKAISSVVEAA